MSRRTKIILVIVVALILIAVGVLLYFLFGRQTASPTDSGTFSPSGGEIPVVQEPVTILPEGTPVVFGPILRQLSTEPIAGAVLGGKGGEPIVRYQDRATGNIYEVEADAENEKRLTNTTIPKVQEALWSKTGAALVSRYVRENSEIIESFSSRVVTGSGGAEGELKGTFLPRGILDGATSPDGTSLFYLTEEGDGVAGIRSDMSGNSRVKLWASPLREWLVSWPATNKVMLLSKPSALAEGMLLSLDPVTGKTTLLLRNLQGLTALANPARSEVLYSASGESTVALALLNTTTGTQTKMDIRTFPEKCAWNRGGDRLYCGVPKALPPGSYPDAWYQGVISFEDEVWSVTTSGTMERILDISAGRGTGLDLIKPELSPDEKFLIFTDKQSGILWSLQMKE